MAFGDDDDEDGFKPKKKKKTLFADSDDDEDIRPSMAFKKPPPPPEAKSAKSSGPKPLPKLPGGKNPTATAPPKQDFKAVDAKKKKTMDDLMDDMAEDEMNN